VAKFNGNILNLSENIAKSFREGNFLTDTVYFIDHALIELQYCMLLYTTRHC